MKCLYNNISIILFNNIINLIVYVDKGNGDFQQRAVKTGQRANGLIQILSGIKAGEVVSTSANFLIDSEARLKGGSQWYKK